MLLKVRGASDSRAESEEALALAAAGSHSGFCLQLMASAAPKSSPLVGGVFRNLARGRPDLSDLAFTHKRLRADLPLRVSQAAESGSG